MYRARRRKRHAGGSPRSYEEDSQGAVSDPRKEEVLHGRQAEHGKHGIPLDV